MQPQLRLILDNRRHVGFDPQQPRDARFERVERDRSRLIADRKFRVAVVDAQVLETLVGG